MRIDPKLILAALVVGFGFAAWAQTSKANPTGTPGGFPTNAAVGTSVTVTANWLDEPNTTTAILTSSSSIGVWTSGNVTVNIDGQTTGGVGTTSFVIGEDADVAPEATTVQATF